MVPHTNLMMLKYLPFFEALYPLKLGSEVCCHPHLSLAGLDYPLNIHNTESTSPIVVMVSQILFLPHLTMSK